MLRLSKAGYGSPEEIMKMDVESVMRALDYEMFISQYQSAMMDLNMPDFGGNT